MIELRFEILIEPNVPSPLHCIAAVIETPPLASSIVFVLIVQRSIAIICCSEYYHQLDNVLEICTSVVRPMPIVSVGST